MPRRQRTIKAEFCKDVKVGKLTRDARLLYIGIWSYMDRSGIIEFEPEIWKIEVFPYDLDIDSNKFLALCDELFKLKFLVKFTYLNKDYALCPNFKNHQSFHKDEQCFFKWATEDLLKSIISGNEPIKEDAGTTSAPPKHHAGTTLRGCLQPGYRLSVIESDINTCSVKKPTERKVSFDFVPIYKKYPRQLGKTPGIKICKREIKTEEDFLKLSIAVDKFNAVMLKEKRPSDKIPYFSTFMSSWSDWLDKDVGTVNDPTDDKIKKQKESHRELERKWEL